jgi:hypothetical protein
MQGLVVIRLAIAATKHPNFVLMRCEKAYSLGQGEKAYYSLGQDAYTFPLQVAVNNTLQFRNDEGYLTVISDHAVCLGLLTTMKQVRPLCSSRLHVSPFNLMLTAFSLLLLLFHPVHEAPENNHFGYIYTINDNSDITPPSDQLESMDMHMLNHQLVNFMQQVLENANQSLNDFFLGPAYPQYAINSLGYSTITKLVGYTGVKTQNAQSKSSRTLPCVSPSLPFSAAFATPRGQGRGHWSRGLA